MKEFVRKYSKVLAPLALVLVFVLVPVHAAHAQVLGWIQEGIRWFLGLLIGDLFIPFMGKIMILITEGIIKVAGYNGFGSATAVTTGWVLMRDIANMVFVVALLLMAFGTMLDMESLGNTKQLPRLLVMAVAINFSKLLTLFIIDIGQVVMLTFVAAFQATAAGNFVKAFGITDWFTLQQGEPVTDGTQFLTAIIGMFLAAALVTVATAVLIVFFGFLIMRMVTLWVLIIFSPLAFGLSVLAKRGKKYYDKWWDELINTVITGPLIAFFLWLTLIVAGASSGSIGQEVITNSNVGAPVASEQAQGTFTGQTQSKAFSLDTMITFIVSIAMLMLGLKITQETGAAGVGQAMALKGKATGLGKWALKKTGRAAAWTAKKTGSALYNAPIVPGSKGGSLAGVVAGAGAVIVGSKIGKAVGLNKEYTESQNAEKKAKSLRLMGRDIEARKVEQAVISEQRKKLEPYTQDQVEKKFKEMRAKGDTSSLAYRASALELAGRGYFTDKHSSIDKAAAGDTDFKNDLVKLANDKGANYVNVKGGDSAAAVRDMMAGKSDGDLRVMFGNIDKGVQKTRDIDGGESTADPYATEKLMNLDERSFNSQQFGEPARKKVRDALMLAMKNETDTGKRDKILQKYNTLNGTAATVSATGDIAGGAANSTARQKELFDGQQKKLTETYTGELRKARGNVGSIDSTLIEAASSGMNYTQNASVLTGTQGLQRLTSTLSNPVDAATAEAQSSALETRLRQAYQSLDTQGKQTYQTDKDGNVMNFEQLFDASTLRSSIQQMRTKLHEYQDPAVHLPANSSKKDALEKEIRSIQNLIDTMSQQMRPQRFSGLGRERGEKSREKYEKIVVKKAPKMDARITTYMNNAKSANDGYTKVQQMSAARREMEQSVKMLRAREDAFSVQVKNELAGLQRDIKRLEINPKSTDMAEIKPKLDELKRLHDLYEKLRKQT